MFAVLFHNHYHARYAGFNCSFLKVHYKKYLTANKLHAIFFSIMDTNLFGYFTIEKKKLISKPEDMTEFSKIISSNRGYYPSFF